MAVTGAAVVGSLAIGVVAGAAGPKPSTNCKVAPGSTVVKKIPEDTAILALSWYDASSTWLASANIPASEFAGGTVTLETPARAVRVDGTFVPQVGPYVDFSAPCNGKPA